MKRIGSISWLVAALACSSVEDKQKCTVSTDCPVGQYCAHAEGESRCWADGVNPVVQSVTATCTPTPCLRDGVMHVEASITDDAEVLDASVSLDLPTGTPIPMMQSGGTWVADVELRRFGFPAYSQSVTATVTAHDGARNASAPVNAIGVAVTRLKWTYDAAAPITSPAVMDDGTAVVGVSATTGQIVAIRSDGTKRWSLDLGTAFVSAAPTIGASTIWVGSEDFFLYGIQLDGSAVKAGVGVNTGGGIRGSVAVLPGGGKEWAFAASDAGFLGAASTVANEYALIGPTAAFSVGPIIGLDGRGYAATGSGSLRAYRLNTSPAVTLTEVWSASIGVEVAAPLASDSEGAIWTVAVEKLSKVLPGETSGAVTPVATLGARIVDSPVVLASGDVVVGDQAGILHRFTTTGAQVWAIEPNLGSAVHAPAVLANGDATLFVPTAGGKLFALRGDGAEVWSTTLDTGKSLRAANIFTPPGQTSNIMSTAYIASSSGKLFAVIVDGQLDAAAPWPKAFHDPRNTNRAGPQP